MCAQGGELWSLDQSHLIALRFCFYFLKTHSTKRRSHWSPELEPSLCQTVVHEISRTSITSSPHRFIRQHLTLISMLPSPESRFLALSASSYEMPCSTPDYKMAEARSTIENPEQVTMHHCTTSEIDFGKKSAEMASVAQFKQHSEIDDSKIEKEQVKS